MEIYALSGPSGTGKSTIALQFAYEKKIPAIIDDGLLIVHGNKKAGFSAKFEKNALTAVKRATFMNVEHRDEVRNAIKEHFIGKILIIGTSDKMVRLIARNLALGEIMKIYQIGEIRSSSEIQIAKFIRRTEGTHVIPIPYRQVEQNFFKKLIQKGIDILSLKNERIGEITIVHPDFHKGLIKIHKHIYREIIRHTCLQHEQLKDCKSIHVELSGLPVVNLSISLQSPINYNIIELSTSIQADILNIFEEQFCIEIHEIKISIIR